MKSKVLDDPVGWAQFTQKLTGSTRIQIRHMERDNQPQHWDKYWDSEQYLGCQVFIGHLRHRSSCKLLDQAPSLSTPDAVLAMLCKAQRAPAPCSLVRSTVARLLEQLAPTSGASPALGPAAPLAPAAPAGGERRGIASQAARVPKRPRSPDHCPQPPPPPAAYSGGPGALVGAGSGGRAAEISAGAAARPASDAVGAGAAEDGEDWEVEITGVTRVDDPVATVDLLDD